MDTARGTAALAAIGLVAALGTPAAAHATGGAAPQDVAEQVVARVVDGSGTRLEAFGADEHGSLAAARRAALATPGVQEVAVPVETRVMSEARGVSAAGGGASGDASASGYADGWGRALQWHLDRLGGDTLPASVTAASDVLVAVLDTGVRADHEDWAPGTVRCDLGADFSDRSRPTTSIGNGCTDGHGHGTHVAGLVAAARGNGRGVAGLSQAQVLPVAVLAADGSGTDASAAAGIYWAVNRGADVISMSLGGPAAGAHYDDAVAYATARGVPVVAAAGNNRQAGNTPSFPAALPDVISVAASGRDDRSASFSYSGPTNDLAAPGVGIYSLGRASASSYVSYSGTSQAAPLVAAVAAMWLAAHPDASVAQVTRALVESARDVAPAGKDADTGAGVVDPVRLLSSSPAPGAQPAPAPAETTAPAPAPETTSPPAGSPPASSPPAASPPASSPPARTPPAAAPPAASPSRPAPAARPAVRPGLALPRGTVGRGTRLQVTAGRMAPGTVVTVTARYAQTVRVRVSGGRVVSRSVVRSVVVARGRTDRAGALVLPVALPKAATRVRLVVTGTGAGGRRSLAQSIVTVR